MSKHGKVLVAMSGGIDSTISAILLHQQGYDVVGITMKTWDYASSGGSSKETGCCSLDSINDARHASVELGFPHFIIDIREEFGDFVIDNFVSEYMAGRTPNPCVLCNTHIKWEALLKRADALGCDFIATGHYAQLAKENSRYFVTESVDKNKDQTYALWGVSQMCLERTIFPIGGHTKAEVREIASSLGFEELAKKSESYEICFVPDNDYRGFLRRNVHDLDKLKGGKFVDVDGNVMGDHDGFPFYTIGQRKGLGVVTGEPVYVKEINPESNTIVLGDESSLERRGMWVDQLNLQKYGSI
ncbi:MAG: tRNA 2-thiouridine(34) synthase MnmA, partial [Chitinophagales bacterium]|nr:tRNA 2-thiouridine(34) synthase MnmA [Chitinophagales bacterium]